MVYEASEVHSEEWRAVAHAVPKRQREFAVGRACARKALCRLGWSAEAPLLPDGDRVPRWPSGVTGCISHSDEVCAVAVGRRDAWLGIGIDVELATPLDATLEPVVCRPAERAWLDRQRAADRGVLGKLLFSAKEAAYKCHYPLTRVFFDFQDMEVEIDMPVQRFRARLQKSAGDHFKCGDLLQGDYRITGAHIATSVAIRNA